ncbi:MAG: hypothetical protein KatS3mg095_0880 [Candidatus Parcubacteria bacterium]|nr:MAG: hypothetical protein KatS3mg095_0880 [Candidatus Parcubacteria bacterium]
MKIDNIKVNKILDSRGEWTIEVEVESEGIKEKASIPSGKSVSSHEVVCLDCDKIEKNLDEFLRDIKDKDFKGLQELDYFLIERAGKNKEILGGNFTLGVSIAFGRILAKNKNLELFEYLNSESTRIGNESTRIGNESTRIGNESTRMDKNEFARIPGLVINIIGGGVHSFNNLDFQEYWLVTQKSTELTQNSQNKTELTRNSQKNSESSASSASVLYSSASLEILIAEIINIINQIEKKLPRPLGRNDEGAFCTNFSDNYEPFLYLSNIRANSSPKIRENSSSNIRTNSSPKIRENLFFELGADIAANQITKLVNWKNIYRKLKLLDVKYLEDPFKEDEFEKFAELRKEGFKVIGDDLTATNIERLKIALEKNSIDGVIVKPNQIGTITETFNFVKLAKENNLFTIFSHRSGETNDHWIIDIGIAFDADYFKIGVPLQGERVTKYNRLLEIFSKIFRK